MTETTPSAEWTKARAEFDAAEQAFAGRDATSTDTELEAMGDRIARAASVLMAMPAPSGAALKWKLQYLTAESGGWCWNPEYYRQTVADIDRYLPDDDADKIRADWEDAVAEFERCEILERAAREFGPLSVAETELELLRARGAPNAETSETADNLRALEEAYTREYLQPLWQAQRQVALTPAPDHAAAAFKVDLIATANLSEDAEMPDDLLALIHADIERLGGKPAAQALSAASIAA